jgi:hypothetical protein
MTRAIAARSWRNPLWHTTPFGTMRSRISARSLRSAVPIACVALCIFTAVYFAGQLLRSAF